jgi:putative DNA primase/helicase
MARRIAASEIKKNVDIVEIIGRFVHLKKAGAIYKAPCCFHEEKTASLTVTPSKQTFKCYGCGAGGDVIAFLMAAGRTFPEALNELDDPYNTKGAAITTEKIKNFKPAPIVEWKPILHDPPFVEPKIEHWSYGKPKRVWEYKDEWNRIIGYTCRFEIKTGKDKIEKQVLPFVYCTDGTRKEWRWKGFANPRPIYNLPLIIADKIKPIVISEGEKTADAITDLLDDYISVTWIGGANAVPVTDWKPLYGREIVLWPDNDHSKKYAKNHPRAGAIMDFQDQPGNKAMLEIFQVLKDHCPNIKWVQNPNDTECGWDAADAEWTKEEGAVYFKSHLIPVPNLKITADEVGFEMEDPSAVKLKRQKEKGDKRNNGHFKMLGYDKESGGVIYYFYSYGSKSVIYLSPGQMGKNNLLQLAPLYWWELNFWAERMVFSTDEAADFLITESHRVGIFNEKWIRGRGAWVDDKRVVIHTGNKLIVNGVETNLSDFKSKYIYEVGDELGFNVDKPATVKTANKLIQITNLLNWDRPINSYLLAGWCVIAPVCGALLWRSHIWLTGGAGSGKSWVFQYIVRLMLGECALAIQGEVTEPAIRQTLQHDALPVVFDEAEGNDKKNQDRMQAVLGLMRTASTSDGGIVIKGGGTGKAATYRIRSCFAYASINVQIANQADQSRIATLGLKKAKGKEAAANFAVLLKKYSEVFTSEFTASIRARTIKLLPVILHNTKIFSAAAAEVLGEQRAGDQIGTLLAGAYSLFSNKNITYDAAVAWINKTDWEEEKNNDFSRDEFSLMEHLMGHLTRMESVAGIQERTIGELVQICAKLNYDPASLITESLADDRLKRLGIIVKGNYVIISNSASELKKILLGTAWYRNHNKILLRIEGALASNGERFSSGVLTRAVKVPLKEIFVDKAV